ncbi:MAG: hypothetical protein ACJAS3_003450 [Roseivirga sp.]|jgi:hypothetical protein
MIVHLIMQLNNLVQYLEGVNCGFTLIKKIIYQISLALKYASFRKEIHCLSHESVC